MSESPWRGPAQLVGAAALFSVMSVLVKTAGETLPAPIMVLARAIITLVLSFAWLRVLGIDWRGHRRGLLMLRGTFGFTGLACFFFALTRLPLAEVTVIHYLNPIFTAALAAVVLKERVGAWLLAAMALSLTGVLFVARPAALFGESSSLDPWGVAAALVGAVASAAAYVTVRKLRSTEQPLVIVLWFSIVAVPASLPLVAPVFVMPAGWEWALLLGIGLTTQAAQVLLTRGLLAVPAGRATTIAYVQIVFAALWGTLWFGEPFRWSTALGTSLIFAGTAVVIFSGRRAAPTPRP